MLVRRCRLPPEARREPVEAAMLQWDYVYLQCFTNHFIKVAMCNSTCRAPHGFSPRLAARFQVREIRYTVRVKGHYSLRVPVACVCVVKPKYIRRVRFWNPWKLFHLDNNFKMCCRYWCSYNKSGLLALFWMPFYHIYCLCNYLFCLFIEFFCVCCSYFSKFRELSLSFLAINCEVADKQQILFSECFFDLVRQNVLDLSSVLCLFKCGRLTPSFAWTL